MANEKKLDCVILGLLSHEPMTGYEIKKRIVDVVGEQGKFVTVGTFHSICNKILRKNSGSCDKYK